MKTFSLYVHIPFCKTKCSFCSFAVAVNHAGHAGAYLEALQREAMAYRGSRLSTLYIGGGTPSLLSQDEIGRIFVSIHDNFSLTDDCEITFECNPETITEKKAHFLRECGVTRVSLGVQSMDDRWLRVLGRSHTREDTQRAWTFLRTAGHRNINVDLMYGMEGQSREDVERDIAEILGLGCEHVSLYSLTIEERSLFFARKAQAPGAADEGLYEHICQVLGAAGVVQYEISNFSREGFESRHNMNYWQGGEYVGLGMAAHSHINGRRFWNADTLPRYMKAVSLQGHAMIGEETLPCLEKMMETLLFSLRMNRGVDLGCLQKRFGVDLPAEKIEAIESFIEMGLLEEDGMLLRATVRGRSVLDEISARLI